MGPGPVPGPHDPPQPAVYPGHWGRGDHVPCRDRQAGEPQREGDGPGAAKAHFQVKEKISLHTSGAAKATYSGDPIILSLHSSGASNINKISSKLLENKKEYEK